MTTEHYQTTEAHRKAVVCLHDRGGHFVLCKGKRPIWPAWQRRRPGLDVATTHGPEIGIIPWSIGTSALDIDLGDIGELVEATMPLATLASPRGHHLYYGDDTPRGNTAWCGFGCRGDVRSARGFLRLYEGGAERLASALAWIDPSDCPFPADLFDAAGIPEPRSVPVEPATVHVLRAPRNLQRLETVQEGRRNRAVFDHLRFWAYPERKDDDLAAWRDRCLRMALAFNLLLPDPLPESEVADTAWSVCSWTWSGGGPLDHRPPAQSRRGVKSGEVRRGVKVGRQVDKRHIADRDAGIVEAVTVEGRSMRTVARTHGLTAGAVHHIVQRDAPLFASAQNTLTAARPWDAEGISRRTWYRRRGGTSVQ